jgi:hypothetical protein
MERMDYFLDPNHCWNYLCDYNQYLNCKSTAHIQLSTLTFSQLAKPNYNQYLNCKSTAHIQLSTLTFGQVAKPNYNQYLNCKSAAHIQLSTLTFGPGSIGP